MIATMEVSLYNISLGLVCSEEELLVPPQKTSEDLPRVGEWQRISGFCAQPPADLSRAAGRRLLSDPRELAVRFE